MNDSDTPLAEFYYDLIFNKGTNPISTLVSMCLSVFGIGSVDKSFYARIGKLIKVYGKKDVYYAILSFSNSDISDTAKIINYISYNCNKRFENSKKSKVFNDLSKLVEHTEQALKDARNLTIEENL